MDDASTASGVFLVTMLMIVVGLGGYFLPWLIASGRNHHRSTQVFVLNLFLGWTLLGWVIALVMAVGPTEKETEPPEYLARSATGALPPPETLQVPCWNCGTLISPSAPMCWKCAAKPEDAPAPIADKDCPFCKSTIPGDAIKCRHCGEWVVPESERPAIA